MVFLVKTIHAGNKKASSKLDLKHTFFRGQFKSASFLLKS